jgi:hypothetical protein
MANPVFFGVEYSNPAISPPRRPASPAASGLDRSRRVQRPAPEPGLDILRASRQSLLSGPLFFALGIEARRACAVEA